MKELSARQIAASLAGHLGGGWPELRLVMLFQSEAADPVEVEPRAMPAPLAKAA